YTTLFRSDVQEASGERSLNGGAGERHQGRRKGGEHVRGPQEQRSAEVGPAEAGREAGTGDGAGVEPRRAEPCRVEPCHGTPLRADEQVFPGSFPGPSGSIVGARRSAVRLTEPRAPRAPPPPGHS